MTNFLQKKHIIFVQTSKRLISALTYTDRKISIFLHFFEKVLKKRKNAHSYPVAVCAYSLLADILLGLGNDTYAVESLLRLYCTTFRGSCQYFQ